MKMLLSILLTTCCTIASIAQATVPTTSDIKKITVFRQKAQIEAVASVKLTRGRTIIKIEDIAGTTDENSLQINGTGNFTILGVKYQPSFANRRKSTYEDSLKTITSAIDFVKMEINVAANETAMILQNASDMKSNTNGLFPKEFKEMIEFTRKNLTETGARKLKLEQELSDLQKRQNRLNDEINTIGGGTQTLGEILVTVAAESPTTASLSLTYLVNGAGWNPTYDIRSNGTDKPVILNYKANVYQRTGIDWENVQLSLSTTNPLVNNTKPELYPRFLTVYEPRPVMMRNMKVAAPQADMISGDAMVENAFELPVEVTESTLAVAFDIAVPYSVASTGNPETIDVQSFTVKADYSYVAVPTFGSSAFLVAKLADWERLNLLPGEANIYFEGMYIGKTYINPAETKDELPVSLGVDKKIIVERKALQDFKSRRFIGNSVRESFMYETTIRNTKNQPATITVEEQVPVSQDSRIELSYEPKNGVSYDPATGKVTYVITLPPNQKDVKRLEYEVKYPKELRINNL